MGKSIEDAINNLRTFIELSQADEKTAWNEWITATVNNIDVRCWEKKNCDKKICPAYLNSCGRCWLIAGTMCGNCPEGEFAIKYKSCLKCDIFQGAVFKDPVTELEELIIILIFNFRQKHNDLQKALENTKMLSGLLPICSSCRKIRDDEGYWKQIEEYIREHSEAEFSHGICPDCAKKLYPLWYKDE